MRELNSDEQRTVSGGRSTFSELTGWVPDNVLLALRVGNSGNAGAISLPVRTPGLIPGPGVIPGPVYFNGPSYEC